MTQQMMDTDTHRELTLHALHEALGAVWRQQEGWLLPAHYGDPVVEHRAARASAGLVDASARLVLRATGSDRVEFLQGLTTNHIKAMKPGQGTYNVILTPKGRIVGELIVYGLADHLLLDIPSECAKAVQDYLDHYHFSEEVEFTDVSARRLVLGLHGPKAAALLEEVSTVAVTDLPDYHLRRGNLGGVDVMVARVNRAGEDGFEIHAPAESAEAVWGALAEAGAAPVGQEAAETLRIEAGIPRFGADLDERVIPWEAGIGHAIHLNKGCYVGQEVVARMEYLGKVSRRLVALRLEGTAVPAEEAAVRDGEDDVGRVTSACVGPTVGQPVALAYVKRDRAAEGTVLDVEADGGTVPATVAARPLAGSVPPPHEARG
ncbi:MAG: aminomethyltransferase family protein [bacterium]|nr:aminomethyltransferase family protein [bacterium]